MGHKKYINSANLNRGSNFPYLVMDIANGHSKPQPPGFHILHWHEDLQIVICLQGQLTVRSLYESITLNEGQAVFINKNVVHQIQSGIESHYKSLLFPLCFVDFYPGSPSGKYAMDLTENCQLRIFHFSGSEKWEQEVLSKLTALIDLEETRPAFYEYEVLVHLHTIFLAMLRHIKMPAKAITTTAAERIQVFLQYIALHYAEELTLEDIAASVNVSKSECLRCFHQILQTTPYKYVMEYRLQRATALLEKTDLAIGIIARQTGFQHTSYLGKRFKERTGLSPKEYRKRWNRSVH